MYAFNGRTELFVLFINYTVRLPKFEEPSRQESRLISYLASPPPEFVAPVPPASLFRLAFSAAFAARFAAFFCFLVRGSPVDVAADELAFASSCRFFFGSRAIMRLSNFAISPLTSFFSHSNSFNIPSNEISFFCVPRRSDPSRITMGARDTLSRSLLKVANHGHCVAT